MEDLGITQEEQSLLDSVVLKLRARCEELLKSIEVLQNSLPTDPAKGGDFAKAWLNSAEGIARQVHSLGEEALPQLEHFVFQPRQPPTDRLPELLRTRLDDEQIHEEQKLIASSKVGYRGLTRSVSHGGDDNKLETVTSRKVKTQDCLKRLADVSQDSKHLIDMHNKRRHTEAKYSVPIRSEGFDGVALLRLYKKNSQRGVRAEEVQDYL